MSGKVGGEAGSGGEGEDAQSPLRQCLGEGNAAQMFQRTFGRTPSTLDPGVVKFEPGRVAGSDERGEAAINACRSQGMAVEDGSAKFETADRVAVFARKLKEGGGVHPMRTAL